LDFAALLKDRIDLSRIPFSDRSARIMFFRGRQAPEPGERPADFFTVRLAERWEKQQAQVGHYRQRRPVIDEFVFIDAHGNPLPFELTTYPHEVIVDTPAGRVRMCFTDAETLFFILPPGSIGMRFRVHAPRGQVDRRGGVFRGTRNVAYTTNVVLLSNEITAIDDSTLQAMFVAESVDGAGFLLNITPRLGFNRAMPDPVATLDAAAARWQAWFAAAPPVEARYQRQYYYAWWIMRAGLISPRYYLTREGMTLSKIHYVGVWQWDAFFHLFIEGLQRCGRSDLAAELRDRTLDLVMQRDDIFEYYHRETGEHPPKAAPIFGWTSAVFIDLAIKASNGVVI